MRTVVLVPRRGGGWRDQIWKAVYPSIQDFGFEIFLGDSDTESFVISQAWNNAAKAAGDWDYAVLHLADNFVPAGQVQRAVELESKGIAWCFDRMLRINENGTAAFLNGKRIDWLDDKWLRPKQLPYPLGSPENTYEGPRVVPRALWEMAGGFDERYVGWGADDQDFTRSCEKFEPSVRVPGIALELWHPLEGSGKTDVYYSNRKANRELFESKWG